DLASAIRLTLKLDDELNGVGDLTPDRGDRHRQAGHADHLLKARERVARCVGVYRGHRSFVTGIHRLQHVEGFFAAALAEDDAVGTHAQCVFHEFALSNLALAFNVRRPRLHAADMGLLQLQFRCVFDRQQTFLFGNERGKRVEHGRLARTGAARNNGCDARLDRRSQHLGHSRAQRADFHELGEIEWLLGKLTDRDEGAIDTDRTHRDVDARAVQQARVAERVRFIDAAANCGNDFIDDTEKVLLVLEAHRQRLEYAGPFDIDAFMPVDQDIVDRRIIEERLERTQTGHLVENFRDEIAEFLGIERKALDQHILRNKLLDVPANFFFGYFIQRREIDFLDQTAVQAHLGVEKLFAEQRTFRRLSGRALLGRRLGKNGPGNALKFR